MLQRMYSRWSEKRGFKVSYIEESSGDEAGIKSCTLLVEGFNAYGWGKTESGVHRLVRISPFDSSSRRHTSFASIWVYPEINNDIDIEIEDKDLRIDTYRASGAGGQHVNKTDSAIRITHLPTNTVVQCQNDRSQHRNKAQAMSMLKAKLYEIELKKREEALRTYREALELLERQYREEQDRIEERTEERRESLEESHSERPQDVIDEIISQFGFEYVE